MQWSLPPRTAFSLFWRVVGDVGEAGERPDMQPLVVSGDPAQRQVADEQQRVGCRHPLLHQLDQVGAAGDERAVRRLSGLRQRGVHVAHGGIGEGRHERPPAAAPPFAAASRTASTMFV